MKSEIPKLEDNDDYWLSPDLLRIKSWIQLWDNVQVPENPIHQERLTDRIMAELDSEDPPEYEAAYINSLNITGSSR